ncbi:MAG TPA: hypothetical protein PKW56_10235 [Clostridiales bacterium]|nr:hypothetical protein [Clostridiales bacterium]
MRRSIIFIFIAVIISYADNTLKEIYDAAGPGDGYDKLVILEKGKLYKGGLFIGKFFNPVTLEFEDVDEKTVKIEGNGAIIDLMNGQMHIAYSKNYLDIDSCVIINGTLRYTGHHDGEMYVLPYGKINNVTFYNSIDYGIRMEGSGENMDIKNNLAMNCRNTRGDFDQYHSTPSDIIRTGTSYSFSIFSWNGFPDIYNNWSYNKIYKPDSLLNFSRL